MGKIALQVKTLNIEGVEIWGKLFELADFFTIDLAGYAIMSNYLHVI